MSNARRFGSMAFASMVVASLWGAAARAQDAMSPDAEKTRQLVARIQRSLGEIDGLLLGGARPEHAKEKIDKAVADIDELLNEARSKSQMVSDSIDELIKMAKYQQSQQPSGGSSGDSDSPPAGSGQQPRRDKSKDPQELAKQNPSEGDQQPSPADSKEKQGEQDKKGGEEKDKKPSDSGDPKSNKESNTDPKQVDTDRPPPSGEKAEFQKDTDKDRWGLLPPKEAEDLQRHRVEEFPQRYRIWMEMYYRRVNSGKRDR